MVVTEERGGGVRQVIEDGRRASLESNLHQQVPSVPASTNYTLLHLT